MNTEWDAPVGAPGGGAGEMSYVYAVGRAGPALDGLAARLPGVDGRPCALSRGAGCAPSSPACRRTRSANRA
ncbi:hypothetical protein SBADM41S_04296 [Streptomyces badius]